ncbi:MAG: tetratricopeptide repeat protein [Tepidisphaeraceae bacterium]
MRFMSKLLICPVLCLAAALAITGCAPKKGTTQKEKAYKQWAEARANVMYGLGKEQYKSGNFDPARKTVADAIKIAPENAQLRVLSAKLAIEGGQLEMADKELAEARRLNPKDPEADYLAGVVYQRWQKPDKSLEFYTSAAAKDEGELAYILARSEMLVALGRGEEALRMLQDKVVYFEHSAVIRDAVGQLLLQFKRYGEAADMLRTASILATDDVIIQEHLALALFFAERYNEAIDPLQRLLKREENAKRGDLFFALGKSQLEAGKLRDARATLETAAQIDGSDATVWLALGRAAMQLGDFKRSELSLRRAQGADPTSSEVRLMIGYLRLKQGKVQDALASFQRASVLDSSDTVSLCMVGYALQQLGRHDEATRYYGKALKMKPGDEMARKLLASVDVME